MSFALLGPLTLGVEHFAQFSTIVDVNRGHGNVSSALLSA
jgi:hypothetical protein